MNHSSSLEIIFADEVQKNLTVKRLVHLFDICSDTSAQNQLGSEIKELLALIYDKVLREHSTSSSNEVSTTLLVDRYSILHIFPDMIDIGYPSIRSEMSFSDREQYVFENEAYFTTTYSNAGNQSYDEYDSNYESTSVNAKPNAAGRSVQLPITIPDTDNSANSNRLFKTSKNKPGLIYNSKMYLKDKYIQSLDNTVRGYFKCKDPNCSARCVCDVDENKELFNNIEVKGEHSCNVDEMRISHHLTRETILDTVVKSHGKRKLAAIYGDVVGALQQIDVYAASNMPTSESLQSACSRRIKSVHPPYNIKDLYDTIIPSPYNETNDGELFLFHSPNRHDGTPILIYCTLKFFRILCNSEDWYIVDTFRCCPTGWYQLFTIHMIAKNSKKLIPLMYVLLNNKCATTYSILFKIIKDKAASLNILLRLKNIMSDSENSLINSIKDSFVNVTNQHCWFHICSNMYKAMNNYEGLGALYHSNNRIKNFFKMLMLLAHVKVDEVYAGYGMITTILFKSLYDNTPWLSQYCLNYFIPNYLKTRDVVDKIKINTWNVSKLDHATNNDLESWHSAFNRTIMNKANFWIFINAIRAEQQRNEVMLNQNGVAGQIVNHQQKKVRDSMNNFKCMRDNYLCGNSTLSDFLNCAIHHTPF